MNSYIVRIYRCNGEESREIMGLVEEVATQVKIPFHSSSELLKILTDKNQRQSINNIKPSSLQEGI